MGIGERKSWEGWTTDKEKNRREPVQWYCLLYVTSKYARALHREKKITYVPYSVAGLYHG
jgi:hypothetical protein